MGAGQPDLMIPRIKLTGIRKDVVSFWLDWNAEIGGNLKETRDDKITLQIHNIGLGAARNIRLEWRFDLKQVVKVLSDYCDENRLPIEITTNQKALSIESENSSNVFMLDNIARSEHDYILPISTESHGLEIFLPYHYTALLALALHILSHQMKSIPAGVASNVELAMPPIELTIHYHDTSNIKYSQRFEGSYSLVYFKLGDATGENAAEKGEFVGQFELLKKPRDC